MAYIAVDDEPKPRPNIAFPLPYRCSLRGNRQVELRRIFKEEEAGSTPHALEVARVLNHVWHLLNYEIVECGDSYPFPPRALTRTQCLEYYGGGELFALVDINPPTEATAAGGNTNYFLNRDTGASYDFGNDILGVFYIKPNYPYRSSIVCNGGFMVVPQYQNSGAGVGTLLGTLFVVLAADLGYTGGSLFNLVYGTNIGSIKLWQKLKVFELVNTIPNGGQVKVTPSTVAAMVKIKNAKTGEVTVWTPERVEAECVQVNSAGESVFVVDAHQFYCDVMAAAPPFIALLEERRTKVVLPSKI